MSYTIKNCLYCQAEFKAPNKEIARGYGKFCSIKCNGKYKSEHTIKKTSNVICANCDKSFYKSKSRLQNSKSGLFFCCRACKDHAQKIGGLSEIQPPHYGSSNGLNGYRKLAFDSYENKCMDCGYNQYIEVLQVHHIDYNHDNNKINNLIILCPTCHYTRHFISKIGYWKRSI